MTRNRIWVERGETTPAGPDFGGDLVLKKDGEKLVVQAKRWKGSVGVKAVQEVVAGAGGAAIASAVTAAPTAESSECPRCGSQMVLRTGKRGRFWGCSSFPACRFTKDEVMGAETVS